MTEFARRPIALFLCCLCSGMAPLAAAADLLATDDLPLTLRSERKFNTLGKARPDVPMRIGMSDPVRLNPGDAYPSFIIADQIEGQIEVSATASGHAEMRKIDAQVFADKMTYWPLDDEIEASGAVQLLQEGLIIDTAYLRMRMAEQIGFTGELDYRMQKIVDSKFYQPTGIVVTAASSNTTLTSAPMMANVANSYGLPTATPGRRATEGNGHAERADFEGENQIRLKNATYSTCKPDDMAWYLKGSEVHLDYDEDVGEAKNAAVWFHGLPIFYSPVASFPLNQQRKSGFLHATLATSTNNGLDITTPYYWNIAPNYDVIFNPRLISKRGFQLGANINYIDYNYSGRTRLEYMPDDKILQRDRYGYNIQHRQNFGRGFSGLINWNGVSDDAYWEDLSSRLLERSQIQIPRQLQLGYAPSPWLQTSMVVQRYQTLQTDPANPVARPYFLEPQLNILAFRPNVMKTDVAVIGQFSRFVNPDKIAADRTVFYPQISLPIVHPAFQITPKIGLHMTRYALRDRDNFALNGMSAAPPDSVSRSVPVLSLDSTVVFERESRILDFDYIQTLEPRLYYVNIPYKNQTQIPVFDSALTDFNFAQIFSENRYSGFDRINDANQLTAAVTTRFLDASTGVERFKAMVGQRYYFSDQRVTLPGEAQRNTSFSNLIAALNGLVWPKTYADAAIEYDYDLNQVDRFSLGARYQPDFGRVISASYRYTRDPLSLVPQVDQFDLAGQWPLSARWYAVGRYNYSLRDNQALEAIAGLEYNAGCWSVRGVVQRLSAVSSIVEPNTSFFIQLELNDLGSIGSNPIGLLRRSIPGYGKINELPNSSSLLTTP